MLIKGLQRIAVATVIVGLVGRASGVKQSNVEKRQFLTTQPAKAVAISLNDDAQKQMSDKNQNALLDRVKRALTAQNLLNEELLKCHRAPRHEIGKVSGRAGLT